MKRFFLLIGLICFISLSTHAQIMFQKHYGGSGDETGNNVLQTSDGGYIVTGSTDSYGLGGRDIYVIKTDEYGNVSWSNTYGGSGDDQSTCIIQAFDGNYLVSGITDSYGAGGRDMYCIKLDQNGDTIWTKTYGSTGSYLCSSIIECADNGLLLIGSIPNLLSGYWDVYCIKTDLLGDTVWTQTFTKKNFNSGSSVVQTIDGDYLIAAITSTYGVSNSKDGYIIKLNNLGDTIWTKTIDKGMDDWAFSTIEMNNGDIMVSGVTNSNGAGGYDVFLGKYDNAGNELWFKTYGGSDDDWGGVFQKTNDSGFAIVGSTYSFGQGIEDVYLIKTDSNGDTLWTKTYGGTGDDWGSSVKQTSDNGYIVSGDSRSFGNGREMYLIKTREDGVVGFEETIALKNDIRIFPNPSDGHFTIETGNYSNENISCSIYDIYGVLVFSENWFFIESNSEKMDLSELPTGLYYINLTGGHSLPTTKLLIQK